MQLRLVAIIVCCGLVDASRAEAGKITFEKAGVIVDVADSWTSKLSKDGAALSLMAPDRLIAVEIGASPDPVDATWDRLLARIAKLSTEITLHPRESDYSSWTGVVGVDTVELGDAVYTIELGVIAGPIGTMYVFTKRKTHDKNYLADTDTPAGASEAEYAELRQIVHGMTAIPAETTAAAPTIPTGAQAASKKIARAIERGDVAGFVKLVGKKGLDGTRPSKLKRRIKKAGGVASFLGVPDAGDWTLAVDASGRIAMWRGELAGAVLLILHKEKKRWVIAQVAFVAP